MPGLFDSITIKDLVLKNRLVMAPMATNMATEEGEVTDRHLKHYAPRADGGVGLIIIEHTYVAQDGKISRYQLGIYDDKLITGLKRLVETIHQHGAKAVLQLTHGGSKVTREMVGKQPAGPWSIIGPGDKETPRPLTVAEIKGIVKSFSEAARRAIAAGFDGVEVHGAHGFLLCQFLSPLVNRRPDRYGGDLEGRLRLPAEIIAAVRSQIGEGVPLFYRFGADDMVEGGLTPEEARIIAPRLEKAGVDVLDISGGLGGTGSRQLTEQGYFVPLAQSLKEKVRVPVIGVGNITEADYADRVIREGRVDLIALGRKLLSTPDFPKEAAKLLGVTSNH
ncbi:MAG: NADH:flavin oxidoreductase [Chloroflexi bacterium]|nr:NADH:flavin oxidoreductase [Chloroflexota bacterium]